MEYFIYTIEKQEKNIKKPYIKNLKSNVLFQKRAK